ncbi:MAG TPA: MFS transporter [Acidimicrobiales bacterium]|jgi:EmrB/QacA subfamily drug resistance transporter
MSTQDDTAEPEALSLKSAQGRWVLAVTVIGSGIAGLDATVVNIALPSIGRSFHSGEGTLQWVVSGYALTLAAFLLLGGSLGDRLGRKRIFTVGVAWFAVASALCGLAPDAGVLIAARLLQGVGGALLAPASLAILQASFRESDRGRAIGAWSGLGGVATAAGPLIGGYLIAAGSWRFVFYINLPFAVMVMVMATRHVPETRDDTANGKVDAGGAVLAVLFLAGLTYGLIEGPAHGWTDPLVLGGLIMAGLTAPAFLLYEHSRKAPMLPLEFFRSRQFSGTNAVTFLVYAALSGAIFLLPTELQLVEHDNPLESGLALLPVTALMLVLSAQSGQLAARIGPRLQMSVGPLVIGGGLCLLARATDGSNYFVYVLPAVLIFAVGLTITVAPLTATAMASVPATHAGVASAINNVVARAGGLIAVAVLPLVGGIAFSSAHFASGFRVALVVAGVTCAAGGVLAALTIRNPNQVQRHSVLRRSRPYYCAVDGAPLQPDVTVGSGD